MDQGPPSYHPASFANCTPVTDQPWLLVRTASKVDLMEVMLATYMQTGAAGRDIFYGWREGAVDDRKASRSARHENVLGRYASKEAALAAARAGRLAWTGHERDVRLAAAALRAAELAREQALWKAVEKAS